MKKFATLIVITISMLAIFAMPAQAASLRVSAKAANHAAAGHVDFTAKVSKKSRVKVTVFQGRKAIRTITARKSGKSYSASWNLADASGASVAPGTYSYTVTAAASKAKKSVKGKVNIPVVTPVPVPVPVGAPAGKPSRWFGFFQQGMSSTNLSTLSSLESAVGTRSAVVNWFESDMDPDGFPLNKTRAIAARGSIPMITLEFWSTETGGLDSITNGSKDAYIAKWAQAAKAYGGVVWIRPLHEMNSNWYPWGGGKAGNSSAKAVAAWKHINDVFKAQGATNVKFVWCVNNESVPNTTDNQIAKYYPGDAYVDILAIDAYNFGTSSTDSSWRSFATAVDGGYNKVTALSNKPLIIAETGSVDQGGNKAAWITEMFNSITTKYTRIEGVCWFNVNDYASSKTDWRVDSTSAALAAYQGVVAKGF